MRTPLDVVVPARDEEALLPLCLRALLWDARDLDLRVVVAANGCRDGTADVAQGFSAPAHALGHDVLVVESPVAGKAAALNAAAAHTRGCPVVFLDADTVLVPGTVRSLAGVLAERRGALLVAPRPLLVRPGSRAARSFAAVWSTLPAVEGDVIGAGCYAVNKAGRERWSAFPGVVADDAFVRSRFAREERRLVGGAFLLELPEGAELAGVLSRWRAGNTQLQGLPGAPGADPSAGLRPNAGHLAARPALWRHAPAFAAVTARARLRRARPSTGAGWERADRLRTDLGRSAVADLASAVVRSRVDVLVITGDDGADVGGCLAGLRSSVAELGVTVVDTASADGSADHVAGARGRGAPVRKVENRGFAAAVNRAARETPRAARHLLLVDAGVTPAPDAIDQLLALALRYPRAGLYGGWAVDARGGCAPGTCLPSPTVRRALAFAIGVLNADARGSSLPDEVCAVPALPGSLLLVDRSLWTSLGGLDERFCRSGADVDLCLRARRAGARPMVTPLARYHHRPGVGATSAERQVSVLHGTATLHGAHLPAASRRVANAALLAGVAVRSGSEIVSGGRRGRSQRGAAVWRAAWRRRATWAFAGP